MAMLDSRFTELGAGASRPGTLISDGSAQPQHTTRVKTVLVVEDDPDIARLVGLHLEDAQYQVTIAADGAHGLELALSERFDLLVLDILLPGLDGLQICREVAKQTDRPMILVLSSRASLSDRLLGLDEGADDYLTKPFSVLELVARVRALFRRPPARAEGLSATAQQFVTVGALSVDRHERCAWLDGVKVELTTREFDLLLWFATHPGRVFTRHELLDGVWGKGYDGFEHTVNSHLNRLRAKIEPDPGRPKLLLTVRGAGYKLAVANP
jgi:DNA-binding response OmpR family regulator